MKWKDGYYELQYVKEECRRVLEAIAKFKSEYMTPKQLERLEKEELSLGIRN